MKDYNEKIWSVKISELGNHWTRFGIPPIFTKEIKKR